MRKFEALGSKPLQSLIESSPPAAVTPAKAGAYPEIWRWIPAFAGMTIVGGTPLFITQNPISSCLIDATRSIHPC